MNATILIQERPMDPVLVDNLPQAESSYGVKLYEQPSFCMPWHMHNLYELTLIVSGQGTRIVGDNIGSFFPGDLLLLGPGLPHVWKNDSTVKEHSKARSITLQFVSNFPSHDMLTMPEMKQVADLLEHSRRGILLQGALRVRTEEKMNRLLTIEGARRILLIREILSDISESSEIQFLANSGYCFPERVNTKRWNKINSFILENFDRRITAKELAEIAHMHPSSLGRYFKQTAGMRLTEYVNQIRIGQACRLLADDRKQIVEICYECGFQNLSYFNRCFRKFKQATPSEYRTKLRGLVAAGNT